MNMIIKLQRVLAVIILSLFSGAAIANEDLISTLISGGNGVDIQPKAVNLDMLATFTVSGENIPLAAVVWIDSCQNLIKLTGGNSSGFQFQCIPSKLGTVSGVLKDQPGGVVITEFLTTVEADPNNCIPDMFEPDNDIASASVKVSGAVDEYSLCSSNDSDWSKIILDQPSKLIISTSGAYSYPGVDINLHSLDGTLVANSQIDVPNELSTDCASPLSAGTYFINSSVHGKSNIILSYNLSIQVETCVNDSGAIVNSVIPLVANFGEETIFTVSGQNFPDTMVFWIHNCDNLIKLSGNTSTQVQFRCTPLYEYGVMPAVVKDRSGGILLKNFTLEVIDQNSVCTKDIYESDDFVAVSQLITNNQTQLKNICTINDKDWSLFTLSAPSSVSIETSGLEGDTTLSLYNITGEDLLSFNDDKAFQQYFSKINYDCNTPLPTGTYQIMVDSYQRNKEIQSYEISFHSSICQSQAIEFPLSHTKLLSDSSFSLSATASSGLTVIYNTLTPDICSVNDSTVSFLTSGECIISANQLGNDNYSSATEVLGNITVVSDQDQDGIADTWELYYGLSPLNNIDASLDNDGDGISNYNEFLQGTNPLIKNFATEGTELLTRSELSKLLVLAKHGYAFTPQPASGIYNDVLVSKFNADWIEQLALDGLTEGCATNQFCPDVIVTKEQLAKMLLKMKHGASYVPVNSATGEVFADISINNFSAKWIEQLHEEGITEGCNVNSYCPKEAVTIEGFQNILSKLLL